MAPAAVPLSKTKIAREPASRNCRGSPPVRLEDTQMKIVKVEDLHCDAGWRVNSFLKVTTDEGIVGWSEYMEGYGAQGLTGVILKLAERFLIGQDPRPVERHSTLLYAATRQAAGGVNQMAIAAIENALVDIKAKALGVPVYEMLGGPVRDRLQLYWSHCGTSRPPRRPYPRMVRSRRGVLARRHRRARRGGPAQGLQGAQDQSDPLRPRQA